MNTTTPSPAPANRPDLAVCYRIYPRVSGRPIFGFTDKLALTRLNLETFQAAAGNLKLKIWFLLDNCPPAYEELVRSLFSTHDLEVIRLAGEGNGATFRRQVEVLTSQSVADLVYFAEDDYLYLPGALERGVAFFQNQTGADFLTLYDHPDYYTKYIHRLRRPPIVEPDRTWRPVAATCLTFMARRTALVETAEVFRTFADGNSDLGLWLALTKRGVLNPGPSFAAWATACSSAPRTRWPGGMPARKSCAAKAGHCGHPPRHWRRTWKSAAWHRAWTGNNFWARGPVR